MYYLPDHFDVYNALSGGHPLLVSSMAELFVLFDKVSPFYILIATKYCNQLN